MPRPAPARMTIAGSVALVPMLELLMLLICWRGMMLMRMCVRGRLVASLLMRMTAGVVLRGMHASRRRRRRRGGRCWRVGDVAHTGGCIGRLMRRRVVDECRMRGGGCGRTGRSLGQIVGQEAARRCAILHSSARIGLRRLFRSHISMYRSIHSLRSSKAVIARRSVRGLIIVDSAEEALGQSSNIEAGRMTHSSKRESASSKRAASKSTNSNAEPRVRIEIVAIAIAVQFVIAGGQQRVQACRGIRRARSVPAMCIDGSVRIGER